MTGTASDRPGLQDHVYSKGQKKRLAKRFKDAKNPLKLVIVRDMWLTGEKEGAVRWPWRLTVL